jgi:hypothetical protein
MSLKSVPKESIIHDFDMLLEGLKTLLEEIHKGTILFSSSHQVLTLFKKSG